LVQRPSITIDPHRQEVYMDGQYDRAAEDLGNIVALEHVNVTVPDQQLATLFYVTGLGLTRDPFLMTGLSNMWVNIGRSQFHLPTNKPQVLRGHVGLVLPDREALLKRLSRLRKRLEGTCFDFREEESFVEAKCPWGNRIRCFPPGERFGRMTLGIAYVEFDVPSGAAEGIARFYRRTMGTPANVADDNLGRQARVSVGIGQHFVFRETDRPVSAYDGHHVQVYVADFSGPHRLLKEKGLITEESDQHQYRFKDIVDPESGAVLFTIEHEVRSMRHPLYMRPLTNRNPSQNNVNYMPGHDTWI
jgi:catechol 2,3-dioxygenase-like lactoylglutathione lyase family enzyme